MIFSVFDPYRRVWDYYEAPGTSVNYGARGTKYRSLTQGPLAGTSGAGSIGFAPEALALQLPSNARKIGVGDEARGLVAFRLSDTGVMRPSYPGRFEEEGGTIQGSLQGLGDGPEQPTPVPVVVPVQGISFGKVVAASVIASIVGVFVQRVLAESGKP